MKKVITYGSFDLFHEGHYKLLKRAKELGDYLIVGITTEQYDNQRGKLNVVDSLMDRIEHVKQTGLVDEIIIEDHAGQKIEDVLKYQIDVFTVGSDWTGVFDYMEEYCEVVYLERTRDISSTMKRARNYSIIKLGIIGTGRIARRFVPELKFVSGINIEAVYNPNLNSAIDFVEQFELGKSTDDLDEFFENIDAVYIASPHETHAGYIKEALEHNKHVLCEKPMVLHSEEAQKFYSLAKEKKCVLMEGIKTAYCPGFQNLMSIVRSGVIGKICDVEACFTKLENPLKRELIDINYGGSFTELASYALLPIIKILGTDYEDVKFQSIKAENGLDMYTKVMLTYQNAMALGKVGLQVKSEGQLIISGTKGYIKVDAPWWKTQSFEVCFEDSSQNEKYFSKFAGDGLRYEISDFVSSINGYDKKDWKLSKNESIKIVEVIEKFLYEKEFEVLNQREEICK